MTCNNCECDNCPDGCDCENCTPEQCECKKEAVKPQDDFGYIRKMNSGSYTPTFHDYLRQFAL
ncbi:MAG TPA: hypothetical protein EYQ21_04585 [Flavobacteriales bacterium]|nr:hypothetical protein [Flavobacteriales bacterium]